MPESLAIVLHLADRFPGAGLLPTDPAARAACLSACAEMHSGFTAFHAHLPFNCAVAAAEIRGAAALARHDVAADVARLCELWAGLIARYGAAAAAAGPFLFGKFSAADCMFAPAALCLRLYDPTLRHVHPAASAYIAALCALPAVEAWVRAARAEGPALRIPAYDAVFSLDARAASTAARESPRLSRSCP